MPIDPGQLLIGVVTGSFGVLVGYIAKSGNRQTAKIASDTSLLTEQIKRNTELEKMLQAAVAGHSERIEQKEKIIESLRNLIDDMRQERLDLMQRIDHLENATERLQEDYIDCQDEIKRLADRPDSGGRPLLP
jgi:chromosome segregation ATPase